MYSQHTRKENQNMAEADSWDKTHISNFWNRVKIRQAYKKCRECSLWTESAQQMWGSFLLASVALLLSQATGRHLGEFLLALHLSFCWMLSLWGLTWCDLSCQDAKCKGSHKHCSGLTHTPSWEDHDWTKTQRNKKCYQSTRQIQSLNWRLQMLFGHKCSLPINS